MKSKTKDFWCFPRKQSKKAQIPGLGKLGTMILVAIGLLVAVYFLYQVATYLLG